MMNFIKPNLTLIRNAIHQKINARFSSQLTTVKFTNGIKHITMCNRKTRNALSFEMMTELLSHITSDENNTTLRVIVIAAEGPVFSSGHNLKELTEESGIEQQKRIFVLCSELMLRILNCSVPVLAKVDGLAAAAGCQLVAQCDLAVCSEGSRFSTPGANFGLFCSTPGIPLARAVPKSTAAYMLFTGNPISSHEALNAGLVCKVVPSERLTEEVEAICASISTKSRSVIELGKGFLYRQMQESVGVAYRLGEAQMVENLGLRDGKEGVRSFVEKRKAVWTHTFEK